MMTRKSYSVTSESFVEKSGQTNSISNSSPKEQKQTIILRCCKNLALVVVSNILLLIGLYADLALIASVVTDTQLVFITLTLFTAIELLCVCAPIFTMLMGSRNLLIVSNWLLTFYFASMFFPTYWSLIPGAIALGLGWPLQWVAAYSYVKEVTIEMSKVVSTHVDVLMVRVFGMIGLSFQIGVVVGNTIAFFTLSGGDTHVNGTVSNESLKFCGGNYCNEDLNEAVNLKLPEQWRLNTLNGILTSCGAVGCIILLFANKVSLDSDIEKKNDEKPLKSVWNKCKEGLKPLAEAMKLWKNPKQLLLFPYNLYLGFEMPFYLTDFTKAFVTCTLGIPYIGAVMACFGLSNMLFCLIQGQLVRWFGRLPIILFGALVHLAALVVFLTWKLNVQSVYVYFILSAMLGIADAVVFTQGFALCGIIFEKQTDLVYSNCTFILNVSFMIAYIYSFFLCISTKVYIILTALIVSIISICGLEIYHSKHSS